MFSDDELLPVSALQHFVFCPRRAALIHIEGLWAENRYTAEGVRLHQRAHDPRRGETRPGVRIARGLEIRSYHYGLVGKADVVEFRQAVPDRPPEVTIVEYKRGRPKPGRDEEFHVQLCAQALCLEEMLGVKIPDGRIFFGEAKRRLEIAFDETLRNKTENAIGQLRELIAGGKTPAVRFQAKCRKCSLFDLCMPKTARPRCTAQRHLSQAILEDVDEKNDAAHDGPVP